MFRFSLRTAAALLSSLSLATLISGCSLPLTTSDTPPPLSLPADFQASGNEPPWLLRIEQEQVYFAQGYTPSWQRQTIHNSDGLTQQIETEQLRIQIREQVCRDSMSGMPHPYSVSITPTHTDGDAQLQGCGGDPLTLLVGRWQQPQEESKPLEITFTSEGQVYGFSGCNRFSGRFDLSGESLTFPPLASTRMACAEPAMTREQDFYQRLNQVNGFDLDSEGRLHLLDSAGERLEFVPYP
ncbi:META domain-containing protein [Marinospirillum sp. MEB164]|uniref:META domain-containing protein n=1 Tax=Marinospirillum alkalitolerans TaxID=3123374 RepID=A0ABW8PYX4_9GAMM